MQAEAIGRATLQDGAPMTYGIGYVGERGELAIREFDLSALLEAALSLRRVIGPALLENAFQWGSPIADALKYADKLLTLLNVQTDEPVLNKEKVETTTGRSFSTCPVKSEAVGGLY